MARFKIYGADSTSGEDVQITVTADTVQDVEAIASARGIMISKIVELEEAQVTAVAQRGNDQLPSAGRFGPPSNVPGHSPNAPTVNINLPKRSSSVGIVAFVLGILALLLGFIPILGMIALPIAAMALLLAIIGLMIGMARRGGGIGWPIGAGFVSVIALLISGFQVFVIVGGATGAAAGLAELSREGERLRSEWEPPSGFSEEQLHVQITEVSIGKVPLIHTYRTGETRESREELLMVSLVVENHHEDRRLDVRELAPEVSFGEALRLVDQAGNSYSRAALGFEWKPVVDSGPASILPGERQEFLLVFDPPIPQATELTLRLPANRLGGRGTVVLTFAAPGR